MNGGHGCTPIWMSQKSYELHVNLFILQMRKLTQGGLKTLSRLLLLASGFTDRVAKCNGQQVSPRGMLTSMKVGFQMISRVINYEGWVDRGGWYLKGIVCTKTECLKSCSDSVKSWTLKSRLGQITKDLKMWRDLNSPCFIVISHRTGDWNIQIPTSNLKW